MIPERPSVGPTRAGQCRIVVAGGGLGGGQEDGGPAIVAGFLNHGATGGHRPAGGRSTGSALTDYFGLKKRPGGLKKRRPWANGAAGSIRKRARAD